MNLEGKYQNKLDILSFVSWNDDVVGTFILD